MIPESLKIGDTIGIVAPSDPLVGDNRYGIDKEKEIGLFAYKLSFPHPITHELISFFTIPTNKPFNIFDLSKIEK